MYSDLPEISTTILTIARIILGLALLLSCYRLFVGPTPADRIVAMELFAAILMAHFILMVLVTGFLSYLDIAMAIAVISFLGTIAFARYLEKKESPQ
ncbi:MAG: monovalent cation/H+ antiporter complex subunit F [Puniceicoccaceae bacterium]